MTLTSRRLRRTAKPVGAPPPQDFARGWIEMYREGRRDETREGFAVVDGEDRFLGLRLAPAIDAGAGELELEYIIDVENRASQRVAERCGYRNEGVMRSIHRTDGRRIDAGLWSRLPTDR